MQNIGICAILRSELNIDDFKGRGVLKVNSPTLVCVHVVIVEQILLQNIVPCGWVNVTKSNFTLCLKNKTVMYYNLLSKIYFLQVKLVKMILIQIVLRLLFYFHQGKTVISVNTENSFKLSKKHHW